MIERWRRPLHVLQVEPSDEAFLTSDGRLQRGVRVTYDRESTERIRLGYACGKCMEPFEIPWPEHCNVCGAPVRERQPEFFAREFAGESHLGSRLSLPEELERLREGDLRDQ
jgi:hypothetical protein